LGLRAGGETPFCDKVIEKILHLGFTEIPRMAFVVEEDVLTAPIYITLCRSRAVVAAQTSKANLFQQAGLTVVCWL
jgi:hypothetical protein